MLHIHIACFVSSSHKERDVIHIHPACLVSPWHHCLKNETSLHHCPLVLSHYIHSLLKFRAAWLWVSGDMTFERLDRLPNRELKQQRRRRLRQRPLKSEVALLQSLSRLFHFVYFVKCWQMFLELNSKGLRYQSSGKEKESCCLVFPSSTKREIRQFHVVVVQRRQRNVQKSVMHVQSCCFANQTYCFFAVLVAVAVVVA